jgi:hypothetical protein
MFRAFGLLLVVLLAASGVAAANPPNPQADDPTQVHVAVLIDESAALSLPPRVERALLLTLQAAGDALRQGEASRARVLLKTFAVEVRGVKRAKRLPPAAADALIARAEAAIQTCARR